MLGNGIKETTATTGTGTVTLSSVTGSPRFSDQFATDDVVSYAIKDGNNWEWGIGKVGASNTLSRDLICAKLVSGTYTRNTTAITLSGSAEVYGTPHTTNTVIGPPAMPSITANNMIYGGANMVSGSNTAFAGAGTTNRLFAHPILITHGGPFNGFAMRGTGSATVDVALYATLPTGLPGRKVVGLTSQSMVSGMNYFSFTSQYIPPGWYFMCSNYASGTYPYRMSLNALGFCSWSDTSAPNPMMHKNQTQGTLPDPFGTPDNKEYSLDGAYVPAVFLRFG